MNSSVKTPAQGRPGNNRQAAFAFFVQGLSSETSPKKSLLPATQNPPLSPPYYGGVAQRVQDGRFLRSQLRRIGPGRCPQARPCRQQPHPITITSAKLAKPELSTLHKIGTFYFALTGKKGA